MLPDGRVLAETTLDGTDVVAIFEVRDARIAKVSMYISDRALLEHIGAIDRPPAEVTTLRITEPEDRATMQ